MFHAALTEKSPSPKLILLSHPNAAGSRPEFGKVAALSPCNEAGSEESKGSTRLRQRFGGLSNRLVFQTHRAFVSERA